VREAASLIASIAQTAALHLVPYIAECFELVFQQTATTTEIDAANIISLLGQLYSPTPVAGVVAAPAAAAAPPASPTAASTTETVDR